MTKVSCPVGRAVPRSSANGPAHSRRATAATAGASRSTTDQDAITTALRTSARSDRRRSGRAGLDAAAQQAELVALGVGEDVPGHVALADVDMSGAEGEQALELIGLIAIGRVDIEVDAVLRLLGPVWDAREIDPPRRVG